jgi:hypothetical protein
LSSSGPPGLNSLLWYKGHTLENRDNPYIPLKSHSAESIAHSVKMIKKETS